MVKAIVGANWGDEGKGKITDMFAEDADIVVRFQGGANAGHTIINNYDPGATVLISTHLISDVERVLDDYIFLHQGQVIRAGSVDAAREETGGSLDQLFREVFRCLPSY